MKGGADHLRQRRIQDIEESFLTLINTKRNFRILIRDMALTGILGETKLRSLCWKIFLCVLPNDADFDEYTEITRVQRNKYLELKEKYIPNATEIDKDIDVLYNNPLSTEKNNPWHIFYSAQELSEEIKQDLRRLYPLGCEDHFQNPELKDVLFNILFIWSRMHPEISYRQGMHEILAVLVYVLETEQVIDNSIEKNSLIGEILDCRFLEHDAFWLFFHLMEDIKPLYYIEKASITNRDQDELKTSSIIPPLQLSCEEISQMLSVVDPILTHHLKSLDIEPQIYCLRWLRLLFQREDTITIWDHLFAENHKFKLKEQGTELIKALEYLALSLLEYMRESLISLDGSGCIHRLLHLPPVENINILLSTMHELMDRKINEKISSIGLDSKYNVQVKGVSKSESLEKELENLYKVNSELGQYLLKYVLVIEENLLHPLLQFDKEDQKEISHALCGIKVVADILSRKQINKQIKEQKKQI